MCGRRDQQLKVTIDQNLIKSLSYDIKQIELDIVSARTSMTQSPLLQMHLANELRSHHLFRRRLLDEFPDVDELTLADTLEGLTNVREMLAAVLRSALADEVLATALAARTIDMKARCDRIAALAKRKRQLVLQAMVETDVAKLTEPDFSASLRQGSATLEVQAEDKIPAAYWKPQPPKLDKLGIMAALKAGTEIEGAALAAPQMQLSVRTK